MKQLLIGAAMAALALPAAAEITLYGQEGFQGRSFTTQQTIRNLEGAHFANRASSAVVRDGALGPGLRGRPSTYTRAT